MLKSELNLSNALTDQETDKIMQDLAQIKMDLGKLVVNLDKVEYRRSYKIGKTREHLAQTTLEGAKQFEQFLPRDVDPIDFELIENQRKKLKLISSRVKELDEQLRKTIVAFGNATGSYIFQVYSSLKDASSREAPVEALIAQISKHFERPTLKKKASKSSTNSKETAGDDAQTSLDKQQDSDKDT